MGFTSEIISNPDSPDESAWPILLAERIESPDLLTVLTYGHGDVVPGYDSEWKSGFSPWELKIDGDCWFGRGTGDNKGQHSINLAALKTVLETKGKLGFNVKVLLEMGEEAGSPGLATFCEQHKARLSADLFIASDGPRANAHSPTVFLGSRGSLNFDLKANLRDGAHHSGNWGGLLVNAATRLMHAWSILVDANGKILVPELLPKELPLSVSAAVKNIPVGQGENDPQICETWGEPHLSPAEKVFGWNTLEILACKSGNPESPANAIPGEASLHAQIRYVVGSDNGNFITAIRHHLNQHGFSDVSVETNGVIEMKATRLDPNDVWVKWALRSIEKTTQKKPTLLPNLGGSLPNDCFANTLKLPTLWVPHSYPACLQHGPNEHLLGSVAREALQLMTGIFWDLSEQGMGIKESRYE